MLTDDELESLKAEAMEIEKNTTAAQRMDRVAALMREAGTLAAEVLADADAPQELRSSAEGVYRAITGAAAETPSMASLRCWQERRKHGPPGEEVPPAPEALQAAQASAATALEMARLAARRSSSVPLGRALGALEAAGEQLVAALFMSKQGGANEVTQAFRVPSAEGLRELTQAGEDLGDYFGEEKPPTGPSEPLKEIRSGDVWLDAEGTEWTAGTPTPGCYFFDRIVREEGEPDGLLGTAMQEHPSTRGWRPKDGSA